MKIFILLFSTVLSLVSIYYGIKLFKLYSKVKKWPKVLAHIISKQVVARKRASASRAGFTVAVQYEFLVNGIKHTGNKTFLVELLNGEKGYLKADAQKFADKLPAQAEVYYNPENPLEAVLYCDGAILYLFLIVFGFFMLLIGLANYFYGN